MKPATLCFLVGFLQSDLGSCVRDEENARHFVMNGSVQSDINDTSHGVDITANELRTISAHGETIDDFQANFDEQVNKLYEDQVETVVISEPINHATSSFFDTNGGDMTNTQDFCPAEWLPMLAKQGQYVANGQYGKVYLVKVECTATTHPTVAVKYETQFNKFINNEIQAGMTFDHAHVVKFYDTSKMHGTKTVIMMEAVSGGDLAKTYKDLNYKDLSKYVLETLHGLKHIHDKGYVHADFKPDQVMLTCKSGESCHAKLGDFGFTDKEGAKEIRGTPLYFSPELLATGKLSKTADMWAFGVSLFEMTHQGKMPSYLAGAISIPELKRIMKDMHEQQQYFSKHFVNNPSPLDKLITGLLQVNVRNRMTVDMAIAAAETWAEAYHGSNDIAAFASNDVSKLVALPSCWTACRGKCNGRQCQADPTPECSNPKSTSVNTKPVVHGTTLSYEVVTFDVYFDILPYIQLDQDARLMTVYQTAFNSGFQQHDIIIHIAGKDLAHDSKVASGVQAIATLKTVKANNLYPFTVKVLRKQLTKPAHKPTVAKLFTHYKNYPYGGQKTYFIYT